jgi:hypothetical protein
MSETDVACLVLAVALIGMLFRPNAHPLLVGLMITLAISAVVLLTHQEDVEQERAEASSVKSYLEVHPEARTEVENWNRCRSSAVISCKSLGVDPARSPVVRDYEVERRKALEAVALP